MEDVEGFVLDNVLGHRVTMIRPMTTEEYRDESWKPEKDKPDVMVIELDNGLKLYASQEKGYTPLFGDFNGRCFTV